MPARGDRAATGKRRSPAAGFQAIRAETLPPDARGWICNLSAHCQLATGNCPFNVLFTREGAFRGGDFHPNRQLNYVISGLMKIVTPDQVVYLGQGDTNVIDPGVPHYFKALEDCLMIEFWDGPFSASFYGPYRRLVDPGFKS